MKIRIFQIDHEKNENKLAFMNYDTVPRRREPVYIPVSYTHLTLPTKA